MKRDVSKEEINLAISAAELNELAQKAGSDDRITQEQFNARADKIEYIAELRKSGKYRILSVDEWDYSDGELIYDFNAEEDALLFVLLDREENQALHQSDLKRIREIIEKKSKMLSGEISARSLGSENTIERLRLILAAWKPITSEVMFFYDPNGEYIGTYPI